MRNALRFTLALLVAVLLMLTFRALFFTTYTVAGPALEPSLTNGDRVLVNRWSYGLRLMMPWSDAGSRLFGSRPERNDLVAFNFPLDTLNSVSSRPVYICFLTSLPGDTVRMGNMPFILPGRMYPACVSADNMHFLSFLYNRYEGRRAVVRDGSLYVDGQPTTCAAFKHDYYWMTSGSRANCNDSRFFGPVPDDHLIGRVSMLLYSVDYSKPFLHRFRQGRTLLFLNNGTGR